METRGGSFLLGGVNPLPLVSFKGVPKQNRKGTRQSPAIRYDNGETGGRGSRLLKVKGLGEG